MVRTHRELLNVRRPDRPAAIGLHALALVHARPLHTAPRGAAVLHLHLRAEGLSEGLSPSMSMMTHTIMAGQGGHRYMKSTQW